MIRSAFCGVTPGKSCKSAFDALFRFTDSFRLNPSLTPSAIAFVSRLRVAVVSAVFSFNWLELLWGGPAPPDSGATLHGTRPGAKRESNAPPCDLPGPGLARSRLGIPLHLA